MFAAEEFVEKAAEKALKPFARKALKPIAQSVEPSAARAAASAAEAETAAAARAAAATERDVAEHTFKNGAGTAAREAEEAEVQAVKAGNTTVKSVGGKTKTITDKDWLGRAQGVALVGTTGVGIWQGLEFKHDVQNAAKTAAETLMAAEESARKATLAAAQRAGEKLQDLPEMLPHIDGDVLGNVESGVVMVLVVGIGVFAAYEIYRFSSK